MLILSASASFFSNLHMSSSSSSSSFINQNKTAHVDASKFIEDIQWLLEDGFSRLGAIQVGGLSSRRIIQL